MKTNILLVALILFLLIVGFIVFKNDLLKVGKGTTDYRAKYDSLDQVVKGLANEKLVLKQKAKSDSLKIDSISNVTKQVEIRRIYIEAEVNKLTDDQVFNEFNTKTGNDPRADSGFLVTRMALRKGVTLFRDLDTANKIIDLKSKEIALRQTREINLIDQIRVTEQQNEALVAKDKTHEKETAELKDENKALTKKLNNIWTGIKIGGAVIIVTTVGVIIAGSVN